MQLTGLLKQMWILGQAGVGTDIYTAEPDAEVKCYFDDGRRGEDGVTTRWLYALTDRHLIVFESTGRQAQSRQYGELKIRRLPLRDLVMVERTYSGMAEFGPTSVMHSTFQMQLRCLFTATSGIEPVAIPQLEPVPGHMRKDGDRQLDAYKSFCMELLRLG